MSEIERRLKGVAMNSSENQEFENVIQWVKKNHSWLSESWDRSLGDSESAEPREPGAAVQGLYARALKDFKPILAALDKNLTFEIGPGVEKPMALILSSGGISSSIPTVLSLVKSTPKDLSIDVLAFKPARPMEGNKLVANIGGKKLEITADDVWFSLNPEVAKIGINLYFKDYDDENAETFGQIGFLFLDFAIGEFDVMTGIGEISFGKLPEDSTGTFKMLELKEQFNIEKVKLLSRINDLASLSSEQRMADLYSRFGQSIAQLKKQSAERRSDYEEFIALRLWSRSSEFETLVRERLSDFDCAVKRHYLICGEGFEIIAYGPVENLKDNLDTWLSHTLKPLLLPESIVLEIGDPGEVDLAQSIAIAYMLFEAKEFNDAISELRLSLAQSNGHDVEIEVTALNLLSVCYLEAGHNEKAVKSYLRLIEKTQDKNFLYDAYSNMGLAYLRLGMLDQTLPWLEKALAINSNKANLHQNFACAYALKGETEKACASIVKCLKLEPKKLQEITSDTDFDGIRNSKEFIETIAQAKQGNSLLSGVKKLFGK